MPEHQVNSDSEAPDKKMTKEPKTKVNWDEMPSGFIGWVLWALPSWTWLRRGVVLAGALAALSVIAITNWYLIKTKSIEVKKVANEVEKLALEAKNLRRDYFVELWARSENPAWKASLLSNSKAEEMH